MAERGRYLILIVLALFLGLVGAAALHVDRDFWRTAASLDQAARAAAGRGEASRALELARKAWARQPGHPGCGLFLASLYLEAGLLAEALEVSRAVCAAHPRTAGALKLQAQTLERLGEREQAAEVLTAYLND